MNKKLTLFPNLLTSTNLFCGFLALIFAVNDALKLVKYEDVLRPFVLSSWLILLAMVLDLLDGIIARLTKTDSAFGLEFDSLADLTSFGIAPAVILYLSVLRYHGKLGWFFASVYVIGGALRLARFNSSHVKTDSKNFTGLPIPAAAGILVSYTLFSQWGEWYYVEAPKLFFDKAMGWFAENVNIVNQIIIPILMLGLAGLMVSSIKFPSFKQYITKGKISFVILIITIIIVMILVIKPEVTIFVLTVGYLIIGLSKAIFGLLRRKQ
ncbi:MAG: CDP-diacylglycerol--serine O-phosphatidyltransferase [Candidatus Firestonebacteria bacterium]